MEEETEGREREKERDDGKEPETTQAVRSSHQEWPPVGEPISTG